MEPRGYARGRYKTLSVGGAGWLRSCSLVTGVGTGTCAGGAGWAAAAAAASVGPAADGGPVGNLARPSALLVHVSTILTL